MTINENKILIALGDQIYAALQLAMAIGPEVSDKLGHARSVVLPLSEALNYLRAVTKSDVSNN